MKIGVFLGGCSMERNVSLASGRAVGDALKEAGHLVKLIDPALGSDQSQLNSILQNFSVSTPVTLNELSKFLPSNIIQTINSSLLDGLDLIFLALHGNWGEDGKIQSLLEMKQIPYTGSKVMASALTMDKSMTKIIMRHHNIATGNWFMVQSQNYNLNFITEKIKKEFSFPLVVKPNDQGSTVGLTIVEGEIEIAAAILLASKFGSSIMVEEFIPGRELTVTVVGSEAFPIIEIKPKDGFYDYTHKYTKGMTQYICPAEIDQNLTLKIQAEALKLFQVTGCSGFARVDFRLKSDNTFYCLEINTLPGMTATSLVPKSAAAKGITFPELCDKIAKDALSEFKLK